LEVVDPKSLMRHGRQFHLRADNFGFGMLLLKLGSHAHVIGVFGGSDAQDDAIEVVLGCCYRVKAALEALATAVTHHDQDGL
jgi:hypothetical protein